MSVDVPIHCYINYNVTKQIRVLCNCRNTTRERYKLNTVRLNLEFWCLPTNIYYKSIKNIRMKNIGRVYTVGTYIQQKYYTN